jgi:hypothetical protein
VSSIEIEDWFSKHPGPDYLRVTKLTSTLGTVFKEGKHLEAALSGSEKAKQKKQNDENRQRLLEVG